MKLLLPLFFLIFVSRTVGQNPRLQQPPDRLDSNENFNGVALIATAGKLDYVKAKGVANRKTREPTNVNSIFRIASITKTFTAVIILQLQEEKKLQLTDKLGKYLPSYNGPAKDKVSLYQLLTYSSGIPDCEGDNGMAVYQQPINVDDFIDKYCSGALIAEPGSKFNYDNGCYIILGRIIEKVTGKSFASNLADRILKPLKMKNTGMLHSGKSVSGLVHSYTYNDSTKSIIEDEQYLPENFFSSAAMYSTAGDLYKFDQGIFNYKLLTKFSVDEMIRPDPTLGNVGLGFWYTSGYGPINTPYVYRPGGILGSSANWIHILEKNRSIILLANTNSDNLFEISKQLNLTLKK